VLWEIPKGGFHSGFLEGHSHLLRNREANLCQAILSRRDEILADPGYIDGILARGAEKARSAAAPVIDRVRRAVGLA
jgi:tryptophanyl-tRNA synthetase